MSGALAAAFADAARPLLVPFLPAGFPRLDATAELMRAAEDHGADIIELGVPFSDPAADGPVIQRANEQALAAGISLASALDAAADYRAAGGSLPVVLMGYANPFLRMGPARLAEACVQAGVCGVLAVDWPPQPGDELGEALRACGIDRIALIAPTTPAERIAFIDTNSSGYLYYVAVKGVTGAAGADAGSAAEAAARIRKSAHLPLAVGFGIADAEAAARYGKAFDAVVVGSRLVEEAGRARPGREAEAVGTLIGQLRAALA